MKHTRFFRILAAAVVLALLMLAIPITPAMGAAVLVISPTSASPGTAISVVTASSTGFTPGLTGGVVWFDTNDNGDVDTGEPYLAASTNTLGQLVAAGSLVVPTRPLGTACSVRAAIPSDGTGDTAVTPFTIIPGITATPSTANVGDTITVAGGGFNGSVSVTIYYDTTSVGTKTTDSYGSFTGFTFAVPASVEGSHTVKAQETSTPTNDDTVTLEIDPDVAINPTSGAVGDTITVTGDGFDASSTVTITFDGTAVVTSPATVTTSSVGTLPTTTFTVPESSRGSHTVKAQDAGTNYDTATFTVGQKITINPTSGPSGATVTVTGTGFAASSTITIKYNNVVVTTSPATVTTNTAGNFSATFTVPAGDAGTYVVQASDASTNTATANYEATTSATISQTTSETAPGHVGMSLTITGLGFTPSHAVTVIYETTPVTLVTVNSDTSGNFTAIFTIPASEGGEHTITVSDGTITKEFDFYMEENAPPTPELVAPIEGEKSEKEAVFEWEEVDDVEPASIPVTYDLQVATSDSFTAATRVINETGLEDAEYTIPEDDKLESRGEDEPYYWRVRAVDAASNESEWSEPETFTVGWSFQFTGWVVWVTMVVVAIVFFFIGLWIGRRGGGGEYY